jgi:hypothetical protein
MFGGLPIVEMGTITEVYADTLSVEIVGANFWVTYYRVMQPPGEFELVQVPVARVGRAIASYNSALFAKLKLLTH